MILRAILVLLLIALAETVHGNFRVRFLNPRIGDRRARRLGVLTGSIPILLIGWFTMPWIGPASPADSLVVGAVWLVLMLAFDIGFGRWVFRFGWKRIFAEFDLTRGNVLSLGMLIVFFTPLIVAEARRLH